MFFLVSIVVLGLSLSGNNGATRAKYHGSSLRYLDAGLRFIRHLSMLDNWKVPCMIHNIEIDLKQETTIDWGSTRKRSCNVNQAICKRCGNRMELKTPEQQENLRQIIGEKIVTLKTLENITLKFDFCADCKRSEDPDLPEIDIYKKVPIKKC